MRLRALFSKIGSRVSLPWLALVLVWIAFMWGNSLIPGQGSGEMSHSVLEMAHSALRALGLPHEWLTNYVVRKTAHFSEYLVLGILASQAFDPKRSVTRVSLLATVIFCFLVPSIDEGIQLFVPGRAGMLTDVLLDFCGAMTGILLRSVIVLLCRRK